MKLRNFFLTLVLSTVLFNINADATTTVIYQCEACPAGTISDELTDTCITCSAGTYSLAGSSSCSTCSAGTYSSSGASSCTSCPAGKYSSSGASSCSTCSAGTYSTGGAASCSSCPAGKYSSSGASSCSTCSAGTYSTGGAASCTSCSSQSSTTWSAGNCGTVSGTYTTYCDNSGETSNKAYTHTTSKNLGDNSGVGQRCIGNTITNCTTKPNGSHYTTKGNCNWTCDSGYTKTGEYCGCEYTVTWKAIDSGHHNHSITGIIKYGESKSFSSTTREPRSCSNYCSPSGEYVEGSSNSAKITTSRTCDGDYCTYTVTFKCG